MSQTPHLRSGLPKLMTLTSHKSSLLIPKSEDHVEVIRTPVTLSNQYRLIARPLAW